MQQIASDNVIRNLFEHKLEAPFSRSIDGKDFAALVDILTQVRIFICFHDSHCVQVATDWQQSQARTFQHELDIVRVRVAVYNEAKKQGESFKAVWSNVGILTNYGYNEFMYK